ncbi:MAG: 4Fe-4S dicluster domain-containing protein [Clostridiales bacterium]|nr:4Fe-4S dicluster domain-containing protein [Clostridiales bacterium]MCF8021948.1 4Fe-4S dicluster domain-containing protein [Clostridiales bacterium]
MILTKKDVPNFLDSLKNNYQVFAPVKQDHYTEFKEIENGADAVLDYSNTKTPPKKILFPQSEKLYCYKVEENGVQMEEKADEQQKVIFGIRPCDAKSFTILDKVFDNNKYQDPYYLNRRKNTILVGIGCNAPESTCFCTSLGGGPFDTTGLDLLLVDIGDCYLVEVISEKGKNMLTSCKEAGEEDKKKASQVKENATLTTSINIEGIKEKLDNNFYNEIWDYISEKCIGCGSCTFSCPTCHCFDIVDETADSGGCRIRNWDSCMFPLFTLHGSGHNPRPSNKERFRNRIMHKFNYFVETNDITACVGCGRCIKNCPVNMDIREILEEIQGLEARSVS